MSESSDEDQMEFEVPFTELHVVLSELSSLRAWLDPELRAHNGDIAISTEAFYRLLGAFHEPPLDEHRPAALDLSLVPEDKFHAFFKEAISRAHTMCVLFAASTCCLCKDVWLQPEHISDALLAMDSTQLADEVTLHLEVLGELATSWMTCRDSMAAGDSVDLRESVKEIRESMVSVQSDSLEAWKESGFEFCYETSELIEQGLASPAMITAMLKELERTSDNGKNGAAINEEAESAEKMEASEMARQRKRKRVTGLRLRVICERDFRRKLVAYRKKLMQRIDARNEQRIWSLDENDDGGDEDATTVRATHGNSSHSDEGKSGEEASEKTVVHSDEASSTRNVLHSSGETGDKPNEGCVQAAAVITQPPQPQPLHTPSPVSAPSDEGIISPVSLAQFDNSSEIKDLEESTMVIREMDEEKEEDEKDWGKEEMTEDEESEEETEGELESEEEEETETDDEEMTDSSVEAMPAQRRDIPSSVNTEDAVENGAEDWQRHSVADSTEDEEEKTEDDEEKETSGETVFGEEEEEALPAEKEASTDDSGTRADEESKQASKPPSPSFHFFPPSAIAKTEEIPKTNYLQQLFDECGIAKEEAGKVEGRDEKDTVEEKETTVVTEEATLDEKGEGSGEEREATQAFEGEKDTSEVVSQGKMTVLRDATDYCPPVAQTKDELESSKEGEEPPSLGCEALDNGISGAAINEEAESAEKMEASEMARKRKKKRGTGRLRVRVNCERDFRRKLGKYLKKLKKRIDARKERRSWSSLEENGEEAESMEKMEASEMARQRKRKRVTGRLRLRVICERDLRRKLVAYFMKLKHKEQRSWLLEENDDEDAISVQVIHGNSSHSDEGKSGEEASEKCVVHSDEASSTRNDLHSSGENGDKSNERCVQAAAVITQPPQSLLSIPSDEWIIAPVSLAQFDNSSETIQNHPRRGAIYGRGGGRNLMMGQQRQESAAAAAAPATQPRDEPCDSRGFGQRGFGRGVARTGRGGMTLLQPRGDERASQDRSNGGAPSGCGARRGAIYGRGGGMGGQSQDSRNDTASRGFGNPAAADAQKFGQAGRCDGGGSFGQPHGQQESFAQGGASHNRGFGDGFGGHEASGGFGRSGGAMRRPQQELEGANQSSAQGRGRGSRGFGQTANYGRGGMSGGQHRENLPRDEAANQSHTQGRGRGSRGFGQLANYGRGGMSGGQHQENLPRDEHGNLVFNRSEPSNINFSSNGRSRKNSDEIWE